MAVPWMQIVRWAPSVLELSRELLRRTQKMEPPPAGMPNDGVVQQVAARVTALEENEKRQAELVNSMAQQVAELSSVVSMLYKRTYYLTIATAAAGLTALILLIVIITR